MDQKRVLIVDDEGHIIELVKVCLEDTEYEIIEAYNGKQALEKAKSEKPDAILLDIMLPKLNGYDVCKKLKSSSQTKRIPVLMLTAKGQEADMVKGFRVGADAYITKPFSPIQLLTELEKRI